jgi:hypothetical protein
VRSPVVRTLFRHAVPLMQRNCQTRVVFLWVISRLGCAALVSGLSLLGAYSKGSTHVPPTTTVGTTRSGNSSLSHRVTNCKTDSECPSSQRCGFTGVTGCEGSGTCVVPVAGAACIDPGGRCGCNGQPVDLFCAAGSSTEFSSAPVGSVGPCPRPCTEDTGCPSHLVCRKDICVEPQSGRSD